MSQLEGYITYVQLAAEEFLRGTYYKSPHSAISNGARTEDQWLQFLLYYQEWIRRHYKRKRIWRASDGTLYRKAPAKKSSLAHEGVHNGLT